ncbi:MAG: NADH-ubiquinone oxidoreductase-F iron-sulfur binding region domain-containing protein [Saprospiraceae bacterium]|nr:NAD(P)H-dependent oxidoreductase subunit E [Saprospiraceae bacterium]MDW8228800.1 NADH-ubiquinone oxidoreductase-F iron-sulfur binding region domain-containing protein [Saprospiraceae bacterium]
MSKNIGYLSGRKGLEENLFERLGQLADANDGTVSPEAMQQLAQEYLIGDANVYGSVTFYDFMRPENRGKKVYVCNGSACLTAGTQPALTERLRQHFAPEEIGTMCCLGRCYENNAFHYAGNNYSGAAVEEIAAIRDDRQPRPDRYAVRVCGTPVLTAEFPGVAEYYRILEECLRRSPDELLNEIKVSGLRGRGGAGFPTAFKWESCKNTLGDQKFIVCNADEGDPGAYSDRYIMEERPHSLLLGMLIAGYIVGAQRGVLYIRGEYPESIRAMRAAIEEIRQAGYLGQNICGSGFSYEFKVIEAQGAYICGEETALLSSIEGQRPEVRVRPPYPTQQGLFNRPTVVNNVETLAAVPFILRHGGAAYAALGRGRSTGTKLVCLDGHFQQPGLCEVDMGTPLSTVVYELGGGFRRPVKAMHIGGPLGGLVPVHKVPDLTVDFESFAQNGFLLGHASVVCIPEDFPMIEYLEHLFEFTAHESCGKCFPCRLGSTRGKEMLHKARTQQYRIDRVLFDDLVETLELGSLCALGGGLPLPVKNALKYFEDELRPYFS